MGLNLSPPATAGAAGAGGRDGGSTGGEGCGRWSDAPLLSARLAVAPEPAVTDCYRLGDGYLDVASADAAFHERLRTLYRECRVPVGPAGDLPRVRCTVRLAGDGSHGLVTFEDGEPLDTADFILRVFPDRGYREADSGAQGWRAIALGDDRNSTVAVSGDRLLFRSDAPWKALAGSVAACRLIRLQRRHLFLHAASIGVDGAGLLVVGPKGAGKTTLSLALAALGHAFLGDEIAGVRLDTRELVPLRRSLAIRTGPRAQAVSDALGRGDTPVEIYPDGSERLRAQPGALFPGTMPVALPLTAVVLLRGFGPEPVVDRFEPGLEHVRDLTPMGATLWGHPAARRAFDMVGMLSRTRCYRLVLGRPEETAARVERLMMEE